MNVNIQETLNKIMAALPEDVKKKVQSCQSKEDFLALIAPAKNILPANLLGGLTGNKGGDKGGANPLAGLLQGGALQNVGDSLKDVDWSEIQKYLKIGK